MYIHRLKPMGLIASHPESDHDLLFVRSQGLIHRFLLGRLWVLWGSVFDLVNIGRNCQRMVWCVRVFVGDLSLDQTIISLLLALSWEGFWENKKDITPIRACNFKRIAKISDKQDMPPLWRFVWSNTGQIIKQGWNRLLNPGVKVFIPRPSALFAAGKSKADPFKGALFKVVDLLARGLIK